jgi:hypothetical protein
MQPPAGCRDPFEIRGVVKVGATQGSPVNPIDDQYATLGQVTDHIRPGSGTGRRDGVAVFRLAIDLKQRAVLRGDPDDDLTPTMRNHPVVAVGQAARQCLDLERRTGKIRQLIEDGAHLTPLGSSRIHRCRRCRGEVRSGHAYSSRSQIEAQTAATAVVARGDGMVGPAGANGLPPRPLGRRVVRLSTAAS